MYCSNCGQAMAAGVRFCPACGAPNAYAAAAPAPAPPALRRRRPGAWVAVLAVLAVAVGAYWGLPRLRGGDGVSTFRGGAGLTGVFPGSGPAQAPKQVWEYRLDSPSEQLLLSSDTLYVTTYGGNLYALNADTGALRWQTHLSDNWGVSVAAGGRLFKGSYNGQVLGLDAASGKQLWQTAVGGGNIFVNYGAGNLYAATTEHDLVALDPATGRLRWRYQTGSKAGALCFPVVGASAVHAICGYGSKGVSVDAVAADGERLWQWQRPNVDLTGFAVDSAAVYVSGDTGLTALDPRTGQEQWGYKPDRKVNLLVQGNRVYLSTGDLVAISTATRQEVWRAKGVAGAPSLAGNTIYVSDGRGLTALDRETGRQLWQVQGFTGYPVPGRGMVFGVNENKVTGWK